MKMVAENRLIIVGVIVFVKLKKAGAICKTIKYHFKAANYLFLPQ